MKYTVTVQKTITLTRTYEIDAYSQAGANNIAVNTAEAEGDLNAATTSTQWKAKGKK